MSGLFIYGGITSSGSTTSDAEVVDISGKQILCLKPPNHPKNIRGAFGTLHYGEVFICGGYVQADRRLSDECYKYSDDSENTLVLLQLITHPQNMA